MQKHILGEEEHPTKPRASSGTPQRSDERIRRSRKSEVGGATSRTSKQTKGKEI